MLSFIIAAVLSQAPAATSTPVQAVSPAVTSVEAVEQVPSEAAVLESATLKNGKKVAKLEGREGCVEQTGSRIKRRDKATCNNGRSISKEDLERSGGSMVPYSAPAIPAAAGN
jgi:hypothetical protein